MKRFRMIAGPNGSGKTELYRSLKQHFSNINKSIGVFVNADELEKEIKNTGKFTFDDFSLSISLKELNTFWNEKLNNDSRLHSFQNKPMPFGLENNYFYWQINEKFDSYLAAVLVEFIREKLLESEVSFCFETVMSHQSKILFLEKAKQYGFKTYLYYIATDSYEINIENVANRVIKGGHDVPKDKIIERYFKSLQLLADVIKISDKIFLFDSTDIALPIAEISSGNFKS